MIRTVFLCKFKIRWPEGVFRTSLPVLPTALQWLFPPSKVCYYLLTHQAEWKQFKNYFFVLFLLNVVTKTHNDFTIILMSWLSLYLSTLFILNFNVPFFSKPLLICFSYIYAWDLKLKQPVLSETVDCGICRSIMMA